MALGSGSGSGSGSGFGYLLRLQRDRAEGSVELLGIFVHEVHVLQKGRALSVGELDLGAVQDGSYEGVDVGAEMGPETGVERGVELAWGWEVSCS